MHGGAKDFALVWLVLNLVVGWRMRIYWEVCYEVLSRLLGGWVTRDDQVGARQDVWADVVNVLLMRSRD